MFAPIVGSSVLLCDYKFGDETDGEIQERFLEMLDQAVRAEDLHTVEEMNTGKYSNEVKSRITLCQELLGS